MSSPLMADLINATAAVHGGSAETMRAAIIAALPDVSEIYTRVSVREDGFIEIDPTIICAVAFKCYEEGKESKDGP